MEVQDFEIISLEHPDYVKRMKAIDFIDDFKTLENIFISDEYITVRSKALDRLTELYEHTNKFKKMIKLWKNTNGEFQGWIPFIISELKLNDNIGRTIFWITMKYNKRIYNDQSYYDNNKKLVSRIVDVILQPLHDDKYQFEKDRSIRWTEYGKQYGYEGIIKVLYEDIETKKLYYDYHYTRIWNTHPDAHLKYYNKLVYQEVKKNE